MKTSVKVKARQRRHTRVRRVVKGTPERLRLGVFRSNKHIYAQIIDDTTGAVLAAASTLSPEVKERVPKKTGSVEAAKAVGAVIAEKAAARSISKVVFDRGGYLYHGRVKALADGARERGLSF